MSVSILRYGLGAMVFAMLAVPAVAAEPPTEVEQVVVSASEARVVDPVYVKHDARFAPYGGPGPFFPDRAARMKVSGQIVLQCRLLASGALEACTVVSETPEGYGFGAAGLRMAERKAVGAWPRMVDGRRVDGEIVRLIVPFNAPERGY